MVGTTHLENPCPKCGGFAHIPAAAGGLVCARCNQPIKPLTQRYVKPAQFPKRTPLRIGMQALFLGKPYYIMGRTCISKKDQAQNDQWYEWLLVNPDGDLKFLQWEGSKWILWESFSPIDEPDSDSLHRAYKGDQFPLDGDTATATDAGASEISGYEGEIPWRVAPDEMVHFARLSIGNKSYYAKVPEVGHPNWFHGRLLRQAELLALFGQHSVTRNVSRTRAVSEGQQFLGICCLVAAVIAFVFWCLSPRFGVEVASGIAPINVVSAQGAWMGPYYMPAGNRVYKLRLLTDLDTPASWVAATLDSRAPAQSYNGLAQPQATQPPAMGPRVKETQSVFRVAKAGWYYVRLSSSLEPAETTAQAQFGLRDSVLYPGYLLFFWLVVGLGGIIILAIAYMPR